jgi:phage terminase small subunit
VVRIPLPEHLDATAVDEFAMLVRYLPRQEKAA